MYIYMCHIYIYHVHVSILHRICLHILQITYAHKIYFSNPFTDTHTHTDRLYNIYIIYICIYLTYIYIIWSIICFYCDLPQLITAKKRLTPTHAELSDAIGNLLNGVGQHRPRRGSACAWGGVWVWPRPADILHFRWCHTPAAKQSGRYYMCIYNIYTFIYKKYHLIQILYIVFVNVVVAFCIAHLLYYTYIYIRYTHIFIVLLDM